MKKYLTRKNMVWIVLQLIVLAATGWWLWVSTLNMAQGMVATAVQDARGALALTWRDAELAPLDLGVRLFGVRVTLPGQLPLVVLDADSALIEPPIGGKGPVRVTLRGLDLVSPRGEALRAVLGLSGLPAAQWDAAWAAGTCALSADWKPAPPESGASPESSESGETPAPPETPNAGGSGSLTLESLRLDLPGLARVELSGELDGLDAAVLDSPLLGLAFTRLARLEVTLTDRGLLSGLERAQGPDAAARLAALWTAPFRRAGAEALTPDQKTSMDRAVAAIECFANQASAEEPQGPDGSALTVRAAPAHPMPLVEILGFPPAQAAALVNLELDCTPQPVR